MLKLVCNTLADGGILKDKDGNKIIWQYLVELHKLQTAEGLRLGNKLKSSHLEETAKDEGESWCPSLHL